MNRILHILKLMFSFLGMVFRWLVAKKSSPNPSGGGGLHSACILKVSEIKFFLTKNKGSNWLKNSNVIETELPLLRRGLGRGLFCLLLSAHCLLATAQSFPVQVIPQVTPPPPIYFSDYANASTVSSPLRVQIILNDFEIANREIRLRTYFEGGGIAFQSNDVVVGASPLFLEGGVPLVLTNVELAPYFRFENISGISPNVYGQAIPEGAYQFCFEVFDVLTGNRISQKSCVTSVVFQNEPPFLISPRNKTNVEEINPQNIVFQWTPRHINVTNVEYELSIVEIWDTQVDPQQAFLSSPPIFRTTTTATTYVYGPADPLFLSGKNYAWRVQAKAKQGVEEIGLFENQGYSEIYSFSYASSCDLPIGLNHEVKGSTNANIFWDDFSTDIPEYTVRYRKKAPSGEGNEWFSNKTTTNQTTLWDLKAGTVYEYQVRKKCAITESDWSLVKQFTTFIADDETSVYECGITPDFTLSNKEPLPNISSGEAFTAGDFPIKILEVSGSNGRFTGKGYVTIPYLNSIKVGVEFTNVLLNTNKQLAEGTVKTIYDPSLKNILDIDEAIETVENAVDAVGEFFEGDNDLDEVRVNWEISRKDITIEDGMVVITNPYNGVTESEPLGDDMVIVDSEGNTYYVDADGSVTEGGQIDQGSIVNSDNVEGVSNNGQLKELTAKGIKVTFTDKGTYGMDLLPQSANAKLKSEYTLIRDADGKDYPLAHHAVKKNGTTQIQANIDIAPGSVYSVEDIIFKNKQGQEITADTNGNKAILTLNGTYTFENETIYATVQDPDGDGKELTAGAFTLWHLTEKTINVVLVSVNGGQLGNVEAQVNKIFQQGVTQINFGKTIDLRIDKNVFGSNGLDVGESAWTKAYNEEQKEFIRLAKNAGAKRSDTYYILVCGPDITNTKGIAGFMPLQRQFGFVFQNYVDTGDEGKGNVAKTLAHEIGHGVFALQHPFSQYGMPQEATDWLMDYDNGAVLPHTQWAQMHDPAIKFYVFQDESEGEIAGKIWFTPDWRPFSIKNSSVIRAKEGTNRVKGTVPGFRLDNGVAYDAKYKSNGGFDGYYADSNTNPYALKLITDIKNNSSVYLFESVPSDCANTYLTNYSYVNSNKNSLDFSSNNSNLIAVDISTNCEKDLCEEGEKYFNDYKDLPSVEGDEEDYLREVAKLICAEQSTEIVDSYQSLYDEWKNTPKTISSNKQLEFSWKKYYQALALITEWRENGIIDIQESTNLDRGQKRNKLFEVALKVNTDVLTLISLEQKVDMLSIMLDGNIYNLFNTNHDALVAKVVASIKDEEAKRFFDILISPEYKNSEDEPLIYVLAEKLSDFLNSQNPYTAFFTEINRLSNARNSRADGKQDVKLYLNWDVEQKDYVLVSFINNKNNYDFAFDDNKTTVNILSCTSCCIQGTTGCKPQKEYLLPKGSSPFDLVGLTIINDVSPFGAGCTDGKSVEDNTYCGTVQIVPAIFLDYLKTNEQNQRLENLGWNIFNVAITVSTLGEGAIAISAIKGAATGQKLYVAGKNAFTLLDFTYTVADLSFKVADVKMPEAWTWVGYSFAAKGGYDLIKNGGAKGVGHLRKLIREGKEAEVKNIIEELGVTNKNGNPITIDEAKTFVDNAELEIKSGNNAEIEAEYNKGLEATSVSIVDWSSVIGKNIDKLSELPKGYQFYYRNGNKWIRRIDASNPDTPRLTVKDSKIVKYTGSTIEKFTLKQIKDYVKIATNNENSNKVMLGMFDGGGESSYVTKAGDNFMYFDFGDKWDEAYKLVNENDDEIWKINKEFINQQKAANKEFWFSHGPYSPSNEKFFAKEINHLIELGVTDFIKEGNLWKAIW